MSDDPPFGVFSHPDALTDITLTEQEHDQIVRALRRARMALGALELSRRSDDIERARKGAEHELETALALLGHPWNHVGVQLPGPTLEEGEPNRLDQV